MKSISARLFATALLTIISAVTIAADRPYSEGPVWDVSYIKVKPGMFDAYMAWVAGERKQLMEEYKKAGIILDYKVFATQARNPTEPDVILAILYKNMAALDGLQDREEPVTNKIWGSVDGANKATIDREKMREVLGGRQMRELILK